MVSCPWIYYASVKMELLPCVALLSGQIPKLFFKVLCFGIWYFDTFPFLFCLLVPYQKWNLYMILVFGEMGRGAYFLLVDSRKYLHITDMNHLCVHVIYWYFHLVCVRACVTLFVVFSSYRNCQYLWIHSLFLCDNCCHHFRVENIFSV